MMQRHLVAMFVLCAPLCACEGAPAPEAPPVVVIEEPDAAPDMVEPCAAGCPPALVNLPAEVSAALGREGSFQAEVRGGEGEVTFTVSERCALTSSVEAGGLVRWGCPVRPEVCALSVQVRDAREATAIKALTVRCEDQAPAFKSSAPETAREEAPYVYEVACEDPEGEAVQVFVSTEDTCGGVVVEGRYEWTPTEAQGGQRCVVGLGCSDGEQAQGQTTRVAVSEGDQAPVFEGLPTTLTAEVGAQVRHDTGALDPEGGAVVVTVAESSCSFAVAVEGDALVFVCAGVERCDLRAQVSDGANTAEGVLSVRCGDTPPRFTEPRPAAAYEDQRYVWPATCEDAEGDPVTVTLVSQDCGGLVFSGGEIVFTPGELMGGNRCEYVVRCASDLAVTEERVMLEIKETNRPPRFNNLPSTAIFGLNRLSSFQVERDDTDYPQQLLALSIISTTCAGAVSRPSSESVGYRCGAAELCEIMVGVSDGQALTVERLTVSCQNSAPFVGNVRITSAQLPTYSVPLQCLYSTQDLDGDPVTALVEWLVDGVVVATGPTLAGYPHGARVRCRVTPSDGQLTGSPASSSELLIPRRQGMAAGGEHGCVIRDSAVYCWGANDRGQLGDGTTVGRFTPAQTLLMGAARGVAAGEAHTCAISAGALYCWGANDQGQLGDGTTVDRATPTAVPGMGAEVTDVSAGAGHTCAVRAGAVYCWGDNTRGQLGDGTTVGSAVAVGVSGMAAGVEEVDAGGAHTCALKGGDAYCWGANDQGQLGDGTVVDRALSGAPVQSQVKLLKAGGAHTCAASATSVSCWGANDQGQLGDGTTVARATPALIVGGAQAVEALEVGERHGCIVRAGRALCWGADERGQAGAAGWMPQLAPAQIGGQDSYHHDARLSLGGAHSCAYVERSGVLRCWGDNMEGQLAAPGLEQQPRPRAVLNRASSYIVTAGARHTCANQGAVGELCWGDNQHGQLGDGTTEERHVPLLSGGSGGEVSAGAEHTCAERASMLWCWGRNQHGQLGLGDRVTRLTPQAVMLPTTPTRATTPLAGDNHTCAQRYGGVMRCWGDNSSGQLGDNSVVGLLAPGALLGVAVNDLPSAGGSHTCTISGGTLYCWGDNSRGQLGDGTTQDRLTPTTVAGMIGGVTRVSAGGGHTCAVKDQALYCWGANDRGQVGDGTTQDRLTPVIIPSLSIDARYLDAGEAHTCATRSGQLYCWGANDRAQLGDGTTVDRGAPVMVFDIGISSGLAAGEGHTCAARDTQLWCWGDNSHGQLGVGAERWWQPLTVTLP